MTTTAHRVTWIALPVTVITLASLSSLTACATPPTASAAERVTQAQPVAAAASALTVAQAVAQQTGGSQTVRGYVVGEPTGTDQVRRTGFSGDTAIALADSPSATDTSAMLYVQVSSAYRSQFGLKSNPGRLGAQLDVSGSLTAYFAHPGLKSPTAMAVSGADPTPTGTTTPGPTTTSPIATTPPSGGDYYADAQGKTGNDLHQALHQIISTDAQKLSYDAVWDALKVTDEDPKNSGNVILLYSGTSRSKSLNGGDADDWNREHVWAKSHGDFGTATGPGTDLHHLRPEDVTVNSDRSNKDFDEGGSESGEAPGNFTDSDSWEPRDAVKGDVARMIFYMAVRYDGGDGFADLTLDEKTTGGSAPRFGKLSTLLEWSAEDPPDSFERNRNDLIFERFQHNRNPFIDHPEWVNEVFAQ
ncbi:endonuclease [Kineosporia succinea]|uniref:Endonuclease I n=1 Tax=Kineosporia succinea TaxID=84632 RepID=A0ABT9P3A3_9ACTN|nr:endonuclease [Kineosporia succinea]MDP9826565.1 endonuclease I [Kineosporia succinea]